MEAKEEFIGFRVTAERKKKIEDFASKRDFSVGELVILAVLKYMGEIEEVNTFLEKKVVKK